MSLSTSCYCGKITVELNPENPIMSAYCHCVNCRKSHAAPVYQVYYVNDDQVKITENEDLLSYWPKEGDIKRYFCTNCGTKVKINYSSQIEVDGQKQLFSMTGIFPALFENVQEVLKPWMHVNCTKTILPIDNLSDELRRFDEFPSEEELPIIRSEFYKHAPSE